MLVLSYNANIFSGIHLTLTLTITQRAYLVELLLDRVLILAAKKGKGSIISELQQKILLGDLEFLRYRSKTDDITCNHPVSSRTVSIGN